MQRDKRPNQQRSKGTGVKGMHATAQAQGQIHATDCGQGQGHTYNHSYTGVKGMHDAQGKRAYMRLIMDRGKGHTFDRSCTGAKRILVITCDYL
jgi:hypothetical protein